MSATVNDKRIAQDVKSGAYKALIWHIRDTTSDLFMKVPCLPETKALRDYLWNFKTPGTQYFSPKGELVAWQWRLDNSFRAFLKYAKLVES